MYLLFRYHNIKPSEFKNMGFGEQQILKAFIHKQVEDTNEALEKLESEC